MTAFRVTAQWLKDNDACVGQIRIFSKLFPDGVEVTGPNVVLAWNEGLDVTWIRDGMFCDLYSKFREEVVGEYHPIEHEFWEKRSSKGLASALYNDPALAELIASTINLMAEKLGLCQTS